ncbi:MAG: formylglycine-generating enzyme family protein [Chitinophagaceae bacterium]
MKYKFFRFLALLIMMVMATSYNKPLFFSMSAKSIQHNLARVNDTLFVNKYETSNQEYITFLQSLKERGSELYTSAMIDSTGWSTLVSYSSPMATYYHHHTAYSNYPVVNISQQGAIAYCNWLTEQYLADSKRKFNKVQFFLPSAELWINVAGNGDKNRMYPWSNYYLRDKNGVFLCNFRSLGDQSISYDEETKSYKIMPSFTKQGLNDRALYTSPVNSFSPGPFGIFNFSGNVAEMVAENGIAKGGSFHSTGYDVRIQSNINYTISSPEVGFRVFMRVIEP